MKKIHGSVTGSHHDSNGMASNLVTNWKYWARARHGSLGKAYSLMGEKLGVSQANFLNSISRYERGARGIPPEVVNMMVSDILPVLLEESMPPEIIARCLQLPIKNGEGK